MTTDETARLPPSKRGGRGGGKKRVITGGGVNFSKKKVRYRMLKRNSSRVTKSIQPRERSLLPQLVGQDIIQEKSFRNDRSRAK